MNETEKNELNDMIKYAAVVLITIVISMTGFWLMIGREYVTRSEANMLIIDKLAVVDQKLNDKIETDKQLAEALDNNTKIIHELQIQLAKFSQSVQILESRAANNER